MNRKTVVMKFGGSSLSGSEKIRQVASIVTKRKNEGINIVVVVSAQGKTTDQLMKAAREISKESYKRELDMLLSAGERVSMALLAMAIRELGNESISFTGSQCGIITNDNHFNARIIDVRPFRVMDELEKGKIVIVAGFQGVSYKREITTLGRGGSDTTAVALAASLDGDCEIYSDVDGVYSGDPRIVDPHRLVELSYDEMMELSYRGAKVLNQHAIQFAKSKQIAIYAKGTSGGGETVIRKDIDSVSKKPLSISLDKNLVLISTEITKLRQVVTELAACNISIRYTDISKPIISVFAKPQLQSDLENLHKFKFEAASSITVVARNIDLITTFFEKSFNVFEKLRITPINIEISVTSLTFYFNFTDIDFIVKDLHETIFNNKD